MKNNKKAVAFCIIWFFFLFTVAMIVQGDSTYFWPFTSYPGTSSYFQSDFDFTEALVYGLIPVVSFSIYHLLSEGTNSPKNH
ncbi:hypothetical protein GCM10027341_55850 [Spirosoma knui]